MPYIFLTTPIMLTQGHTDVANRDLLFSHTTYMCTLLLASVIQERNVFAYTSWHVDSMNNRLHRCLTGEDQTYMYNNMYTWKNVPVRTFLCGVS